MMVDKAQAEEKARADFLEKGWDEYLKMKITR
jgi:hypothetical protein